MAYVVTARCVDCRYTYCVVKCPVACFWEIQQPHMLLIDPVTCVHCDACVPECPVNAIWPDTDVPPEYGEWTAFNAENFEKGVSVEAGTDPLPTARLLDEIQAEERAKGWRIVEPSGAS
jgi:ferredoxin